MITQVPTGIARNSSGFWQMHGRKSSTSSSVRASPASPAKWSWWSGTSTACSPAVDNADTAAPGNKKTRQINALVNEWYLEDLSENIRSVLTSRRRDGYHIGSFALYGYRKDPEQRGHLLVDDEAAAVVREVFGQYASGTGMTSIARQLNHRGIPNPTAYKQQQGLNYRQPSGNSGLWTYSAISSLLRNEMYTGTLVQGKCGSVSYKTKENRPRPKKEWMRVPGTHEAIVSPALWAQVQARLAQTARPMATGEAGPFTGIVRCAGCGRIVMMDRETFLQRRKKTITQGPDPAQG